MTEAANDRRALLQQALVAIDDLEARLAEAREPIAIVGMSCRFPGGATSLDAYWELLCSGRDAVGPYPADRVELLAASGVELDDDLDPSQWQGGFLADIDRFEPRFFGISPREAATMDPQHRLLLEVAWEALEHAGTVPATLAGSLTGVFVGITSNEYAQLGKLGGPDALDVYAATGGALNAAAGRVAYTLGLQGPAMAIDTACSSSLVAVHQASQALRAGDADLALAAGVNLLLLPEAFAAFDSWGMMAPDSRCKAFDAGADGFVRGEGCGVVVLKRLRDAVAAGDRVLAVVRGSAVNQDGASSGLTVPNGPAQQAVLRRALDVAGVAPADVQYFEAHGTGTSLGDPIEVEALGAVLARGRSAAAEPLLLGSVKSNIGHLESAAGIAGLIKVVLALQHGAVPPNLHFHEPSPAIPWPSFPVVVPTEVTAWPGVQGRRVAGVSGFGFSGTNAHVVVESPPAPAETPVADASEPSADEPRTQLLVLSGRTPGAVRDQADRWARALADPDAAAIAGLGSVCATAARTRTHFDHRLGVVAASVAELSSTLAAIATGGHDGPDVVEGRAGHPRVGFVMSGQGSQWVGMGRSLYEAEPVFRAAFDRCATVWDGAVAGRGLLEVSWSGDVLGRTEYTQPALFALEWSLAQLWESWGVSPAVVLGHSVGEFVAAVLAGVMSPEDGLRLVAARGRLMGALPTGGAMVAVMAPHDAVAEVIGALPADARALVGVGAVNGGAHTVVSGAGVAVDPVAATFSDRGVRVSRLEVSHAFHSPLMEPMVEEFARVVAATDLSAPTGRIVSNVSGELITAELADPAYWADHVLAPVRFADGVAAMRGAGVDVFVEIGPHPVLVGLAAADGAPPDEVWVGSVRRGRDEARQVLGALARVWAAGAPVAWDRVEAAGARSAPATMPSTPFQRESHWLPRVTRRPRRAGGAHVLLGAPVEVPALGATVHTAEIATDTVPWLGDHRLAGTVVFPGTGYLEMLLAVAADSGDVVDDVEILEALVVPDDTTVTLQTTVERRPDGRFVQIGSSGTTAGSSRPWTLHTRARLRPAADPAPPALEVATVATAFPESIDVDGYYDSLRSIGLTYGPTFRGLVELHRAAGAAAGRVVLPEGASVVGHRVHPALLDACFHVLGVAVAPPDHRADDEMLVPVAVDGLRRYRDASREAWCVVTLLDDVGRSVTARVEVFGPDGQPVASIDRLEVRRTARSSWEQRSTAARTLYEVVWRSEPRPDAAAPSTTPVVIVDDGGRGGALQAALQEAGRAVTVVAPVADHLAEGLAVAAPAEEPLDVVLLAPSDAPAIAVVDGALAVAQALLDRAGPTRLWLVSRGGQSVDGESADPGQAALWGFGRVLANERPRLECRLVDLDPAAPETDLDALAAELAVVAPSESIAVRGSQRVVARLAATRLEAHEPPLQPYRLDLPERGSLDRLALAAADRRPPAAGEVEVEVRASGLNFRDVLNVLGMYPGDPGPPGLECAGVVTAVGPDVIGLAIGDPVMGIAPCAFDSHVVTRADLVVAIPAALSFAAAATVPIAFLTADYGLHRLAGLGPGDRVLVHAAAGGVGQAAVQLAQRVGAEVHATVGSPEKRRHLEALGVRHIYSSRSLDFADEVLAATDGVGVDVVLNSLSDEFVDRSFAVLRPGGRFLEIGKRGVWSPEEAADRRPDVAYHLYDLADFLLADTADLHERLEVLAADLAAGALRPLPLRAFPDTDVQGAFRFMAQARHIGKVVVSHRADGPAVRSEGAYLVTGGLGGIGLALGEWLVDRGAGTVVLAGRSAPSVAASETVARLVESGADVRVVTADVTEPADVERLLGEAGAGGCELRGVFHAAGITDDGAVSGQTSERLAAVLAPKLQGAELLDRATRGFDLDHFVLFSSASALLGAPGQSGYAAANAALDALACRRRAEGLPALSIDWGAWSDVGMAARLDERERGRLAARGVVPMTPAAALDTLGALLDSDAGLVAVMDVDWAALGASSAPLLRELVDGSRHETGPEASAGEALLQALAEAGPDDRRAVLEGFVRGQISTVLGLAADEDIDPTQVLTELGLDSLMAVELANRLGAALELALSAMTAFEHPTLDELTSHLLDHLSDVGVVSSPAPGPAVVEPVVDPEGGLTDDEMAEFAALSDDDFARFAALLDDETGSPGRRDLGDGDR